MTSEAVAKYAAGDLHCAIGATVFFHWHSGYHDLVRMASRQHYEACDFTDSVTLAPSGDADGSQLGYYLGCSTPGEALYLSCSVGDHCARGQKRVVRVSASERAYDPQTNEPLLHVTSLRRVMSLMGYRVDADGGAHLDRGYGTEAAAEHTLEYVWCLEAHCPDSARDWQSDATEASCLADVHNLAGFLSRKRPLPQLERAQAYYDEALQYDAQHCPTLGYLAELHLMTSNHSAARRTAQRLCATCGASSAISRQISRSFVDSGVRWPTDEACAVLPPARPPSPAPLPNGIVEVFTVSFTLVVAGTVESVDKGALAAAVAREAGVDVAQVVVTLESASVRARVQVRSESRDEAEQAFMRIEAVVESPQAATGALGVQVEAVETAPSLSTVREPAPTTSNMLPASSASEGGFRVELVLAVTGGGFGACVLLLVCLRLHWQARGRVWPCPDGCAAPKSAASDAAAQPAPPVPAAWSVSATIRSAASDEGFSEAIAAIDGGDPPQQAKDVAKPLSGDAVPPTPLQAEVTPVRTPYGANFSPTQGSPAK